jgi:SAM-dependent methyltransferase
MEFTGERYLPDIDWPEISYEHWHRYCYALQYARDKIVLDIASGQGYGTDLLAEVAARAVGVELDKEVVRYALNRFTRPNLQFCPGAAQSIPIEGRHIFDLAVSFETIEHLNEEDQEKFGRELKRLLKPDGLLLMSTPNKLYYSDKQSYKNPFHLKEFYPDEYLAFLSKLFKHTHLVAQRVYPVSYIWQLRGPALPATEYQLAYSCGSYNALTEDRKELLYMIAVCSDADIPEPGPSLLVDASERATRFRANQLIQKERELQAVSAQNSETKRFAEHVSDRLSSLYEVSALHSRQIEQVKNALEEASARHSRQIDQLNKVLDEASARSSAQFDQLNNALDKAAAQHSREIAQIRSAIELSEFARAAGSESWAPEVTRAFEYQKLIHRVIDAARAILPAQARALVVSKGDSHLLQLDPDAHPAWHFPRTKDGAYAGNNPSCSLSAIAHLEALRAQGATHLVIPSTALWWLDHYVNFQRHLQQRYTEIFRQDDTCVIYTLTECKMPDYASATSSLKDVVVRCRERLGDDVAMLDWNAGVDWHGEFPDLLVFRPPGEDSTLPYFDRSIDVVAIRPSNHDRYAEARRVSIGAVLTLSEPATASLRESRASIEWLNDGVEQERAVPRVIIVVGESAAVGDSPPLLSALRASLPSDFCGEIIAARSAGQEAPTAGSGGDDILIFIHDQILPLGDWLPPLLASFQRTPQAGIVAGRLVWGDGRLHSAGGVIFADGSVVGFGDGDYTPEAPLFEFVRQVDCCVGPFLATRRSLFDELQGFDPVFQSCDFKFADYCLRARELGSVTIYQPETQIVCLSSPKSADASRNGEGICPHGDAQLFREKWLRMLRRQPVAPRFFDREAWHALASNGAWQGVPQS